MMLNIKCPKCEAESGFSIVDSRYEGPYKCWKCREVYKILVVNDELKSCELMSQEELEQQQEIEALKAKFKSS